MNPSSGQALTNVGDSLISAGCDLTNVVKCLFFSTASEIHKQNFRSGFPSGAAALSIVG